MRVLLAGDTHGDSRQATGLISVALAEGCEGIVVLGDWGFTWPTEYPRLLKWLHNQLQDVGLWMKFVDGNHENYTLLRDLGAFEGGVAVVRDREVPLADTVSYLPRGYTWEWDGIRFMSLGGAFSVDVDHRTSEWVHQRFGSSKYSGHLAAPGKNPARCRECDEEIRPHRRKPSWWPEELITDEDVEAASAVGPVDVMLTHDSPETTELRNELHNMRDAWNLGYKIDAVSAGNRRRLERVVEAVQPKFLFHGHYHMWIQGEYGETHVQGINRDGTGHASYSVFDTDHYRELIAARSAPSDEPQAGRLES